MSRILIGVCLALGIGLTGASWFAYRKVGEAQVLRASNDALKAALVASTTIRSSDAKASLKAKRDGVAIKQQKEAQDARLQDALKASPDWADHMVPGSVLDALGMQYLPHPD